MVRRNNLPHILYTWLVICLGTGVLIFHFKELDLDLSQEFLIFIALGILTEWLGVSFSKGKLSAGFTIVLAAFLIYGPAAGIWISGLANLIGQGIINRGSPMRVTLFSTGQYILAFWAGNYAYLQAGGQAAVEKGLNFALVVPLVAFTAAYCFTNHFLVYFYLWPEQQKTFLVRWSDILRWDSFTYLLGIPLGFFMAVLYQRLSITGPVLFFIPVFIIQFLLRMYLQVTLANRELSVFYRVAKKLSRPLEADKIFDLILKEARQVVNYHSGIIYLKSEEKDHYQAVAGHGPQVKNLIGTTFTPKEGFLGWMVSHRRLPEIINDVREDLRLKNDAGLPQVCRSLLIIPLQTENDILGIVMLGDKRPFAFQENHQDILAVICHQAAVVLANIFLSRHVRVKTNIDELTGIYSYRSFFHQATAECHRAGKEGFPLALIMLEVEAFQTVIDSFGRDIGDAVLASLARLIKEMVKGAGIIGRYGGEEFVILLPNCGEVKAVHLAENIRRVVREYSFQAEGIYLNLKVSLGVAMYPQDANCISELRQKADEALYQAKKRGKDCVVPFSGRI